jgi:transposase
VVGAALLTRRGDFVAVSTAGPMPPFYERVRMRRGSQIAIVAVARKLAVLFRHLLTGEQDYAFGRPSLTRKKLRALELRAGAERHPGRRDLATKNSYGQRAHRERERELSEHAELAYRRLVADWQASGPAKVGAGATPGRASHGPSKGQAARQTQ